MKKIFLMILVFFIMLFMKDSKASQNMVLVSGANLGIKLQTEVEVIGMFGIDVGNSLELPWQDVIKERDIIKQINDKDIINASDLTKIVEESKGNNLTLNLKRNNQIVTKTIKPILNKQGKYSLGLYVKDYEIGVGTMSFVDKSSKKFASLGHQMIDKPILGGTVFEAKVKELVLPRDNLAGAKKAEITSKAIGSVTLNQMNGVFGVLDNMSITSKASLMEVARSDEAKRGKAHILTSVKDKMVETFEIEITETKSQTAEEIKGLKFRVTDTNLLNTSGGIIQGMSGSPIIQDNKLIGVVTHVVLKDATLGYACYAEFLYNTLGFDIK